MPRTAAEKAPTVGFRCFESERADNDSWEEKLARRWLVAHASVYYQRFHYINSHRGVDPYSLDFIELASAAIGASHLEVIVSIRQRSCAYQMSNKLGQSFKMTVMDDADG